MFALHRLVYRQCEACGCRKHLAKADTSQSVWVMLPVSEARKREVYYPGHLCAGCVADGLAGRW